MTTVGSYEARTHFSELLDRAAKGERILITKRGVPVAALVPPDPHLRASVDGAIAAMKMFGKGRLLRGLSIRELIDEGRRL